MSGYYLKQEEREIVGGKVYDVLACLDRKAKLLKRFDNQDCASSFINRYCKNDKGYFEDAKLEEVIERLPYFTG